MFINMLGGVIKVFHTNIERLCVLDKAKRPILWISLSALLSTSIQVYANDPTPDTSLQLSNYSIAAGPLANSLRAISKISGREIRFEVIDVQDQKVPALNGTYHPLTALQQVLQSTGLTYTVLSNGVIQIHAHHLGAITVTATSSEAELGFKASRSDTATRSGAELRQVPQAITVVTAKVIETQQAQSVQEILQNVSGVVTRESAQGVASYQIRGFTQTGGLVNGVANPYSSSTNVAGIDRIEVLKGPTAILSGGDALGGSLNIVLKKPTAERVRDLTLSYASHQDLSATLDLSDALTNNKKLSYRIVGSKSKADHNDAGFDGRENEYLLAALRWKDQNTDLTIGASYDQSYAPQNRYTFGLESISSVPKNRLGAAHDGIEVETKTVYYDFERIIAPWLTFVSRLQYAETEQDLDVWNAQYVISTEEMIMGMGNSNNLQDYQTLSGDHYLRFNFNTAAMTHKLSVGINHSTVDTTQTEYSSSAIEVPIYGEQIDFPNIRSDENLWSIYQSKSKTYGYFLQDLITWHDFHILLGVRRSKKDYDPTSTVYPTFDNWTTTTESNSRDANSYNVGVVYDLTNKTSVYASYADGFSPQVPSGSLCSGGNDFPDIETENKEIGIKSETADGALAWTLSAYQLDHDNRLEQQSGTWCYYPREGYRVKGIEVEAAGRLLPGLNLIFNYSFNSTKDTGDDENVAGAQPKHQASFWSTYDFQREALHGFGVSLGLTIYSKSRLGYTAEDILISGGARIDAGVSYQRDKDWSVRLNVKNIFDRTLYGYAGSPLYVPVYEGRTASLAFKYHF